MKKKLALFLFSVCSMVTLSLYAADNSSVPQSNTTYGEQCIAVPCYTDSTCNTVPCATDTVCNPAPCAPAPCYPAPTPCPGGC